MDREYPLSFNSTEYTYNPIDGSYRVNNVQLRKGDRIGLQRWQGVPKVANVTDGTTYTMTFTYNGTNYVYTLPQQGVSIPDINNDVRNFQISNNLFAITSNNTAFVYTTLSVDPTTNLTNLTSLPVVIPPGGSGVAGQTYNGNTMQVTFSYNFNSLLGLMPSGTLPATPSTVSQTFLSQNISKAVSFYFNLSLLYPPIEPRQGYGLQFQSSSLLKQYLPINESGQYQVVEPQHIAFLDITEDADYILWRYADESNNTQRLQETQSGVSFMIRPRQ